MSLRKDYIRNNVRVPKEFMESVRAHYHKHNQRRVDWFEKAIRKKLKRAKKKLYEIENEKIE